jgi:type II secretory pathway pseudopilin PulG
MTSHPSQQQGMALIEALLASAILGIGLLGATQLSLKTLSVASQNRQHTLAQQLAQEAMDCLRTQAVLALPFHCLGEEHMPIQGTTYQRQSQSTSEGPGLVTHLQVRVTVTGSAPGNSGTSASELGPWGLAPSIQWHSSVSPLPTWVGVSLP